MFYLNSSIILLAYLGADHLLLAAKLCTKAVLRNPLIIQFLIGSYPTLTSFKSLAFRNKIRIMSLIVTFLTPLMASSGANKEARSFGMPVMASRTVMEKVLEKAAVRSIIIKEHHKGSSPHAWSMWLALQFGMNNVLCQLQLLKGFNLVGEPEENYLAWSNRTHEIEIAWFQHGVCMVQWSRNAQIVSFNKVELVVIYGIHYIFAPYNFV